MKKIAIFTEGQTEQIFVGEYLRSLQTERGLRILSERRGGGRRCPEYLIRVSEDVDSGQEYYALIRDCGSDARVVSEIRDNYSSLIEGGFSVIIALRDLYPESADALEKIENFFEGLFQDVDVVPTLVVAVREIEAWFIAEGTHFTRVHGGVPLDRVHEALGGLPEEVVVEAIEHPSATLNAIYESVGAHYDKSRASVEATVNALDMQGISGEVTNRVPKLDQFVRGVEAFFVGE